MVPLRTNRSPCLSCSVSLPAHRTRALHDLLLRGEPVFHLLTRREAAALGAVVSRFSDLRLQLRIARRDLRHRVALQIAFRDARFHLALLRIDAPDGMPARVALRRSASCRGNSDLRNSAARHSSFTGRVVEPLPCGPRGRFASDHMWQGRAGGMFLARPRGMEWPDLAFAAWKDTYATLHRWLQIVGKIRLAQTPWMNHSWHVPFYLTATGLTTSPIPYGTRHFQFDFDFIDHRLALRTSEGRHASIELVAQPVGEFYARVMRLLREFGFDLIIVTTPPRWRTPCRSSTIPSIVPMTPGTRSASGARCCRATACSSNSAPASPARRARCISSGATRTSRLPFSPARAASRLRPSASTCRNGC